jgi:hypothetical protein
MPDLKETPEPEPHDEGFTAAPNEPQAQAPMNGASEVRPGAKREERVGLLRRLEGAFLKPAKAQPAPDPQAVKKMQVLEALLRFRGQSSHPELAQALNVIDLLFMEDQIVRGAYKTYWKAAHGVASPKVRRELMVELIAAVVLHLNLAGEIGIEDIERCAAPRAFSRLDQLFDDLDKRWNDQPAKPQLRLVS